MSDPNAPMKLRLKSTDTNRFKVSSEEAPATSAAPAQAQPDNSASATQQVIDPISLRDTATGRLRKITENQDAQAAAPTPAMAAPNKTQTVRLKVVRQNKGATGPEPGARPGLSLAGAGTTAPKGVGPSPMATQAVSPMAVSQERPALKLQPQAPANAETPNEPATIAAPIASVPPSPEPNKRGTVTLKKAEPTASASAAPADASAPAEPAKPSLKIPSLKIPTGAPAASSAPAAPKLNVPPPNAAPQATQTVTPTLAKPAAPTAAPAATPTLAKTPSLKKASAPAPTPAPAPAAPQAKEPMAEKEENIQAAPAKVSLAVSIPTLLSFLALAGAVVFDVMMLLEMLK